MKSTVITNLATYTYLSFDNIDKVTVNPSLVTSWNTTISLIVKLEDVSGISSS
jgi:hypothetical protein